MNLISRLPRALVIPFLVLFLGLSAGLFVPGSAHAEITTNVDSRVKVRFSGLWYDSRAHVFRGKFKVINVSSADILPPVRVVFTGFDNDRYSLAEPDGFTSAGAYVEAALAEIVLPVGGRSDWTRFTIDVDHPARGYGKQHGHDKQDHWGHDDDRWGRGEKKGHDKQARWEHGKGHGREDDRDHHEKVSYHRHKHWRHGAHPVKFDYEVEGGTAVGTSVPTSNPSALPAGNGVVNVVFGARLLVEGASPTGPVVLRRLGGGPEVEMFDDGNDPDAVAGDGKYRVRLPVDTGALAGGDCLTYVSATTTDQGFEVVSGEYDLCATSFPVVVAPSNTANPVPSGGATAVNDEVLLFAGGLSDAEIEALAASVGGQVKGTSLSSGLYQIQLPAVQDEAGLNQILNQLSTGGVSAVPNYIGHFDSDLLDDQFALQHGLQLIGSDDLSLSSPRRSWDAAGADGGGITVTVIDSGVQASHPDLDAARITAEIAPGDNSDVLGHGTQMAGIVGAIADNATPVGSIAGVASQVTIESIRISDTNPTLAQMVAGLTTAAGPSSSGDVVLAAFSIYGPLLPGGLCSALDDLISSGVVVVGSAGNDNDNSGTGIWPAKCNDPTFDAVLSAAGDLLSTTNKAHYIVVGASSCNSGGCATDSRLASSNYGSWVDLSAPGANVPTTDTGSGFTTTSGTSPAAAFTAGAAAVLRGCGVGYDQVFNTLDLGATVAVSGLPNRINLYDSLASLNAAPTGVALGGPGSIDENIDTTGGVAVGSLSTTDSTACDAHVYSITGGADAGRFSISGDQLRLDDGVLDFETKSSYAVNVTSTDNFGASTSQGFVISVNDLPEAPLIPNPVLVFDRVEDGVNSVGDPVRRWYFNVSNFADYAPDLFAATSAYGPCGLNTTPSRTWVDFFDAGDDSRLYGFCGLGDPANLNGIWFGTVETSPGSGVFPAPPAAGVYIKLLDRSTTPATEYPSNTVSGLPNP